MRRTLFLAVTFLSLSAWAQPDAPGGEALYGQHCGSCHWAKTDPKAPGHAAVGGMSARAILAAMDDGKMVTQAEGLSAAERKAIAEWWAGAPVQSLAYPEAVMCTDKPAAGEISANGWGGETAGYRSADQAGLQASDVPGLELKWAFGFPGAIQQRSKPAIVGDLLIVGSATGEVYGLDAQSGCIHWVFEAASGVRGAITLGQAPSGALAAYFADFRTNVYAVDVANGQLLWSTQVGGHPDNTVTGSVAFHDGKVFIPLSSMEVLTARVANYECCTSSGAVVALDAQDGERIWYHRVIPEDPQAVGKNKAGATIHAPSGAIVWSSPTIDAKRGLVYFGTGESYTHPASDRSDSIIALKLDSGELAWHFQATAGDAWNLSCGHEEEANCPTPMGPDVDFGMAPILVTTEAGRDVLLVGQKSGDVYALDPDNQGARLWQTKVGKGSALGGVHWGMASDGRMAYAPNSDSPNGMLGIEPDFPASPGVFALRIETGEVEWHTAPPRGVCKGKDGCFKANSAAPTALQGVVFAGGLDGHLRAYDASSGEVLWDFDTVRDYETVNGVDARGGAIDGPGPVIANGMVYSQSGYGMFGQMPGNVLLAFGLAED